MANDPFLCRYSGCGIIVAVVEDGKVIGAHGRVVPSWCSRHNSAEKRAAA